ncbi:PREDICTED: receptor protein kinase TMK1-like [Ipomoea nil]|uniref:receptor protein kinase TMK1-like n=1 Tax=Ipomoea nil TaxID=35883 RepID=UPI000901000F|nr:PREDICTED: receptor protein kinase TMK1-like [Ipomoea nil]
MSMDVDYRVFCVYIYSCVVFVWLWANVVWSATNANDLRILKEFRDGLENPELLKWPVKGNDPCGPPTWPYVFCSGGRVTQIQAKGLGLKGTLPQDFNQLDKLQNLGLQKNSLNGKLPTFSGLSNLQFAYLDGNEFDTIPADFFHGLSNVRVLALDKNPFNKTAGWSIPSELQESTRLTNFSCSSCNIAGPLPSFFGKMPSLTALKLPYNRIEGEIPATFCDSLMQVLWLNNQEGATMTGPIDAIGSMVGLTSLWLHGNAFTGQIPDNIGDLTSLKDLNLNGNELVGLIPKGLANLNLQSLDLNNNQLMGPIPNFKAATVTYSSNSFCQSSPGDPCAPEVDALLEFLKDLNYPHHLASEWTGNDPCKGPWYGITCTPSGHVSSINLQKLNLSGTLSSSLAALDSLIEIHLSGNNLHGRVPTSLTQLGNLRLLDIRGNNFDQPLPKFRNGVSILTNGNPGLAASKTKSPHPRTIDSPPIPSPGSQPPSFDIAPSPVSHSNLPSSVIGSASKSPSLVQDRKKRQSALKPVIIITVSISAVLFLGIVLFCCLRKRKKSKKISGGTVVHPKYPPNQDFKTKMPENSSLGILGSHAASENSGDMVKGGYLIIPVEVLRAVTNNFAPENEIGRGGFGVVYKGVLEDSTPLAVKRMEAGVINNKALDEFHAEIAVLSKVRHRHLVSLLGYSVGANEKLLVYEYMPQGALSRHLFRWKKLNLDPLSWTTRLSIALDVARGMEYLHSLAYRSFIHRDLKPSNILLGDDFRAKVSDFGLVKLAPDRERSVATRLAGTFGYLAPEYAVTGKVTTKVDVFSFGVVLMELLTGLTALDEERPEESRVLFEWFWAMKFNKESIIATIDPSMNAKEDIYDSICTVSELARHCTARDPNHRPDMGHVVNVLSRLVHQWKPVGEEEQQQQPEVLADIDYTVPLPQMLMAWQNEKTGDFSGISQDSKESTDSKASGMANASLDPR